MAKIKRDFKSVNLANKIIEEYQPKSVEDMQNAFKDIFGPMLEAMLKGELNHHLGYESNDKSEKDITNRRNGMARKHYVRVLEKWKLLLHVTVMDHLSRNLFPSAKGTFQLLRTK